MKIDKCELCKNEIDYSQGFYSKSEKRICLDCYFYSKRSRSDTRQKIFDIALAWVIISMVLFIWFVLGGK